MPRKILVGEVSVNDLVERLAFAEEELKEATLEQAKLFMAAATFRVRKMRKRQEAEAAYDDLRTDKGLKFRAAHAGGAKKGYTEKYINDMVDRDPAVRAARDLCLQTKREEEWSKLMLDAYEHRRSSIKVLVQFIYVEDAFRPGGEEVEKLKAKRARLRKGFSPQEDEV